MQRQYRRIMMDTRVRPLLLKTDIIITVVVVNAIVVYTYIYIYTDRPVCPDNRPRRRRPLSTRRSWRRSPWTRASTGRRAPVDPARRPRVFRHAPCSPPFSCRPQTPPQRYDERVPHHRRRGRRSFRRQQRAASSGRAWFARRCIITRDTSRPFRTRTCPCANRQRIKRAPGRISRTCPKRVYITYARNDDFTR